jgi:VWFA-related protein
VPLPSFSCKHPILALAGLALALALAANAQQPAAPSTDVNKRNLLVTVRDKHGKIFSNLSQDDFILEENGHPQVIRDFSRASDLPLTLGLVVDATLSERKFLEQRRSVSGKFIDQLLREDKDKGFLIQFNEREVKLLEDLTPSKQKLDAALDSLSTPQLERKRERSRDRDEYPGPRSGGRRAMGANLYDAIFLSATEMMQKQPGRKAIIVFSDGMDRGSKVTMARAIKSALEADTIVYTVLIPGPQEPENQSPFGRGRGGMGGPGRGPGYPYPSPFPRYPQPEPPPQQPREDHGEAKDLLQRISTQTGGQLFEFSKKTLDQIYQQIQEELRNQYNLGYTSDSSGNASGYRKIYVKTRQKNLLVQARDGFYPVGQADSKKDKKQD